MEKAGLPPKNRTSRDLEPRYSTDMHNEAYEMSQVLDLIIPEIGRFRKSVQEMHQQIMILTHEISALRNALSYTQKGKT